MHTFDNSQLDPYRTTAQALGVDALALVPGANFARLFDADFHAHERPLVVFIPRKGQPVAVVPNLELTSFAEIGFPGEVFDWHDQTGYADAFAAAFNALGMSQAMQSVGVEGQVMRVFIDQAIRAACPTIQIVDAQKSVAALRLHKTTDEIASLNKAIDITETALANLFDDVAIGMTEKALENRLVQHLYGAGADDLSFGPIVAAGTNSAQPHATARDDYKIKAGDALLIDCGAKYRGLCADITRTVFVKHCTDTQAQIYNTVKAANEAGIAASRAGVTAASVDDATTRVLEQSAFGDRIRHKTGHGLGRDVHEDPQIMRGNNEMLEAGMVFTVEPGLYDADDFGVRIEDDVLVSADGCDVLTQFDKSLLLLG